MVKIHAPFDWYRDCPEPEQEYRGVLSKRNEPLGPASRASLAYTLTGETEELPVYAANLAARFEPFSGRRVRVIGKRVDLTHEGFGPELWVGEIAVDAE